MAFERKNRDYFLAFAGRPRFLATVFFFLVVAFFFLATVFFFLVLAFFFLASVFLFLVVAFLFLVGCCSLKKYDGLIG